MSNLIEKKNIKSNEKKTSELRNKKTIPVTPKDSNKSTFSNKPKKNTRNLNANKKPSQNNFANKSTEIKKPVLELDKEYLHFVGLGGCNQIGMNLNVFAYKNEYICVDIGVSFYKKLGIQTIMPSTEFLKGKNITAIFITHAHEDHLGAVGYLCKNITAPIFMTNFCLELFKSKLASIEDLNAIYDWDYKSSVVLKKGKFNVVLIEPGKLIHIGNFKIEFIRTAHSIVESHMMLIKTDKNSILHTGDWKLDDNPIAGYTTDEKRLREIGQSESIDTMTCDSTNALHEGRTESEGWVRENIIKCVSKYHDKRIFVCCFSSNIARIKSCVDAARINGKKIYALGRSVLKNITAAQKLNYIDNSIKILSNYQEIPNESCIVMCTGTQAEPTSSLYRLAYSPKTVISNKDVVIFSSRTIPGNELEVGNMKSMLVKNGALLLDSKIENLHASGHARKEDIRDLLRWVNPRSFVPVHGDCYHLNANAEIAAEFNIPSVVGSNGAVIKIDGEKTKVIGNVSNGVIGLDGNRLVHMNSLFLRDREKLGTDGVIVISVHMKTQTINTLLHGVVDINRSQNQYLCNTMLQDKLRNQVFLSENNTNNDTIVDTVKKITKRFFDRNFKKDPVVIVSINR